MKRVLSAIAVAAFASFVFCVPSNAAPVGALPAGVTRSTDVIQAFYYHGRYYPYRWHGHYYTHRLYRNGHYAYYNHYNRHRVH